MKKHLIIILITALFTFFNSIAMKRSINKPSSQKRKKQKIDIFKIIKNNNFEEVKKTVTSNSDIINIKNNKGLTPLHYATEKGYFEIVKLLINNGANINTKGTLIYNYCDTPLHTAIKNHDFEIVKLLVNKGAKVNAKNNAKKTPLHLISRMQNLSDDKNIINEKIAKLLIENNADIDSKDCIHSSPLNWAVYYGNKKFVKFLINNGAKINTKNQYGTTPIFRAIQSTYSKIYKEDHYYKLAKLLIKNGANVNMKNYSNSKQTPLHYAIKKGCIENVEPLVKLFIDNGAHVYVKNSWGETPLHVAAKKGRLNIVKLLVAAPSLLLQPKGKEVNKSKLSGEALKKLVAYRTNYSSKVFKFVEKLPDPAIVLIIENAFSVINNTELSYLNEFLKQCYTCKDSSKAQVFISALHKNHLAQLKLYIDEKNKDNETAIKIADNKNIKEYLEFIKNANTNDLVKLKVTNLP